MFFVGCRPSQIHGKNVSLSCHGAPVCSVRGACERHTWTIMSLLWFMITECYLHVSACKKPDQNLNLAIWFLILSCHPLHHLHIQCSHPSMYWPRLTLLNFGDQMTSSVSTWYGCKYSWCLIFHKYQKWANVETYNTGHQHTIKGWPLFERK